MSANLKVIWLSHVINQKTPLYGGENKIKFDNLKSLDTGDSCNTTLLRLTSHTGTHVDVPYHFLALSIITGPNHGFLIIPKFLMSVLIRAN